MPDTTTATPDAGIGELPGLSQETAQPQQPASEDTVFHVLQNERRRRVIEYLEGRDDPVRMRDVAEQVAAWEHDTTVEQLSSKQRQRVYIPLYQNHLPKLDEEGLIDYDQSRGVVRPNPLLEHFSAYLDINPHDESGDDARGPASNPWPGRYLAVSALGLSLIGARTTGLLSLSMVSDLLVGVAILASFTLMTLAQIGTVHLPALE